MLLALLEDIGTIKMRGIWIIIILIVIAIGIYLWLSGGDVSSVIPGGSGGVPQPPTLPSG